MTTTAGTTGVVLAERRDGVLTMTINRPGQKNAVNHLVSRCRPPRPTSTDSSAT